MSTTQVAPSDSSLTVMGAALVAAAQGTKTAATSPAPTVTKSPPTKVTTSVPVKPTVTKAASSSTGATSAASKTSVTKPASKPSTKPTPKPEAKDPADFLQVATAKNRAPEVYWPETYTIAVNEKPQDVRDTPNKKVIEIRLYDESCFGCHHVMLGGEVEEVETEECHHSRGNIYCPAAHVRFRSVGKKMRLLHKMRKARDKGDVNKLSALIVQSGEELSVEDRTEVLREIGLLLPEGTESTSDKSVAQPVQG